MFGEYVSALKNYAVFNGRSSRKDYWMFVLYNTIISIAILALEGWAGKTGSTIYNIYSLVLFVPSIAVGVRRLHDINRSGWWMLVPIANLIFMCQPSADPSNAAPRKLSGCALVAVILAGLVPVIGILAAIALPAYQDYAIRAKIAEAVSVGKQAEFATNIFISKNGRFPEDIKQTIFSAQSKYVKDISLNSEEKEILVSLNIVSLDDKRIVLRLSENGKEVSWRCSGEGIKSAYLPKECKE